MTPDLELVSIIHALKMWRHYLLGRKFTIMTNHSGLKYLFEQPKLNARKFRWMTTFSKLGVGIKYIKGKENMVVDALSKRIHVNHVTNMISYKSYLVERVKNEG